MEEETRHLEKVVAAVRKVCFRKRQIRKLQEEPVGLKITRRKYVYRLIRATRC